MHVLVIGKGGREHALVKALVHSPSVQTVHAAPGSDGMSPMALCHDVPIEARELLGLCKRHQIELVIIGPENYLADGLADELRAEGLLVVGPGKDAAQLESSKVFAKKFMSSAQVPTSRYVEVKGVEDVEKASGEFQAPYVLKVDGLAAGKGVFICKDKKELLSAAKDVFELNRFGKSGASAIIEEFQEGWELSYLVLTNGRDYKALPLTQDHKRLGDNDEGPNTGGMGVVGPLSIDEDLNFKIKRDILKPTIGEIQSRGWEYNGVLYVGLMVTKDGPKVIEYNVRFGDPETQSIMPLLNGDWGHVFKLLAEGRLVDLEWKNLFCACVVMAAPGYPDGEIEAKNISGNVFEETPSSYFLHAGSKKDKDGSWLTNGGRVLNSIGLGSSLKEAIQNAYGQSEKVCWAGIQLRKDIGAKVL